MAVRSWDRQDGPPETLVPGARRNPAYEIEWLQYSKTPNTPIPKQIGSWELGDCELTYLGP